MATMTRAPRRAYDAKQRRLRKYRARREHEQRRAPRCLPALDQARLDLGLPETLAAEVEWCLKAHVKRLGNIVGMRCPTRCGCRTADKLTQLRGGDKHLPSRRLGAPPKHQWLRLLQRRGQARLIRLWQQAEDTSPATRRRWPWTWVGDDSVFKTSGPPLGLVGPWDRGQEQRVRLGSDGLLLEVVLGEGQLVVPVDFVVRRPNPGVAAGPAAIS